MNEAMRLHDVKAGRDPEMAYGFRPGEMTRPDEFIDPYVGKDYGIHATEVSSMGMQYMRADMFKFARDDPGHFDFTWEKAMKRSSG